MTLQCESPWFPWPALQENCCCPEGNCVWWGTTRQGWWCTPWCHCQSTVPCDRQSQQRTKVSIAEAKQLHVAHPEDEISVLQRIADNKQQKKILHGNCPVLIYRETSSYCLGYKHPLGVCKWSSKGRVLQNLQAVYLSCKWDLEPKPVIACWFLNYKKL